MKPTASGLRRFLLVRDDFYSDPEDVRRIAQSMKFEETGDITGFMTSEVYHRRACANGLSACSA